MDYDQRIENHLTKGSASLEQILLSQRDSPKLDFDYPPLAWFLQY